MSILPPSEAGQSGPPPTRTTIALKNSLLESTLTSCLDRSSPQRSPHKHSAECVPEDLQSKVREGTRNTLFSHKPGHHILIPTRRGHENVPSGVSVSRS